ncbi:MAG: xylose isomerase, partial [Planctomycetota bacterium]|nr:xylose isomerase [Planctomycetota bacterium]
MAMEQSLHSICRWTFNAGKGGFVPADARPDWLGKGMDTVKMIELVRRKIAPRVPDNVVLGVEMHYDNEVCEKTAAAVADALVSNKIHLAMTTPGAHVHFAYGGIASMDPHERKEADEFGATAVE